MGKVRVDANAADEVIAAVVWYEAESAGLGNALLAAFEHAVAVLNDEPVPLTRVPGAAGRLGAKRLVLHRFLFSLIVLEHDDELVVVAFAHHARRPGYWADRIDG